MIFRLLLLFPFVFIFSQESIELNHLSDGDLDERLKDLSLKHYSPWLRDIRDLKPYQLSLLTPQVRLFKVMYGGEEAAEEGEGTEALREKEIIQCQINAVNFTRSWVLSGGQTDADGNRACYPW